MPAFLNFAAGNAKALVAFVVVGLLTFGSEKWGSSLDAGTKTLLASIISALLVWAVPNRPPPSERPTVPPAPPPPLPPVEVEVEEDPQVLPKAS